MKNVILIVLIILISSSCSNKESQFVLNKTESEIRSSLDSSNYYFDLVISEHNNGVDNVTLHKKYDGNICRLERSIAASLEKVNILGKEGKLTNQERDDWIKKINIDQIKRKYETIKTFGIDFSQPLETDYFSLPQSYSDKNNNFSINFPSEWLIVPGYNQFTLMATGPLLIDSSRIITNVAFGVDIENQKESYSVEIYYKGNLSTIKKTANSFELLDEKDINIDGIRAKYVAFKFINKDISMITVQIYVMKNKKGYILNGSAPADSYGTSRYLFTEIARTFKFQ